MATDDDLTCRELVDLVTDYLEGALPLPERRRFERHVRSCVMCPRYVEQLRATIRVLGRLGEENLKAPVRSTLLATFRTWKPARTGNALRQVAHCAIRGRDYHERPGCRARDGGDLPQAGQQT